MTRRSKPVVVVLINTSRRNGRYHRPVRQSTGVEIACGANPRDMMQVDEDAAVNRYRSARCGKCWRP